MPVTAKIDARIRRLFPFQLTEGQERAIADITADMARAVPMNRLLQGDVGSGKTVVAAYAILLGLTAVWILAIVAGSIAAFPVGLIGLLVLVAIGLLFVKVLKERLSSKEDRYYSENVEK